MTMMQNTTGGIPAGEMMVFSGVRQSGKSYYYQKMLLESIYNANLCKEIILPMFAKPLAEPKYKFSRARWYHVDVDWSQYREVLEWCTEQFGPRPRVSDAWSRWFDNHGDRIFFRDEKDYVWFCMRWGA